MSETNAIQKQENKPAKITTPSEAIAAAKARFLSVMPQETFVKEANFALQIIQNNPKGWQNVDLVSIRSAVENIAFTGLTLNPAMKLAYLIPRKGKAVLDPSYMGLTKILTDSGSVKKVSAVVVYDDEQFEYNASTRMVVVHEQKYAETEKEHIARKVIGAYSCATLADGSLDYEFMPGWELEKIKSKSDGANSQYSPWQESNWADEMRKKTVIKRHYKYLPKSEQISNVIDLDNQQFIVEKPNLNELFVQQQEQPETNNGELPLDITPDNYTPNRTVLRVIRFIRALVGGGENKFNQLKPIKSHGNRIHANASRCKHLL